MVVAEVPLWVVHSNTQSDAAASFLGGATATAPCNNNNNTERAQQSLSLWQGRQKCAIYGLDVHPHRPILATAGGDGTVKLWNTQAFFAPKNQGGHYAEANNGAYVSTSGGSEEESEENGGEGGFSSGVEDVAVEGAVHDLNNVVRRKKDGTLLRKKSNSLVGATSFHSQPPPLELGNNSPRHMHQHHHHRLISTLSAHTGSSVLAVRFSPSGKYLASAGDDAVVCIYAPNSSSAAVGNLSGTNAADQWSRIKLCRGHTLDVVDLAWAPDDSHLVSCSLDSENPIIVWKMSELEKRSTKSMICNPYKVLGRNVHTSTVKGVAFDPAGSYLASSGDDPAICIWRAHDDWGLEKRIDAQAGIFRSWKGGDSDDVQTLSNQSIFRRLSWSTDGAFLCATNAVVKNKHVASTISREGWSVSSAENPGAVGAANLVGHKQPVVVSRHASQLLDARKPNMDDDAMEGDDDDEPASATLLALGDRRGFVTVWSTRKSRPLFKLQCSESRCTVTDLAWGRLKDKEGKIGDVMLLVSLLDGQIVVLRFSVPDEMGPFLSPTDQARVFQLRYGIDMEDDDGTGHRRLLVGQTTGGARLIENALQMSLEDFNGMPAEVNLGGRDEQSDDIGNRNSDAWQPNELTGRSNMDQQLESRSPGGKKRVRPVLITLPGAEKRPKEIVTLASSAEKHTASNPMQAALDAAQKTSALRTTSTGSKRDQVDTTPEPPLADTRDGDQRHKLHQAHEAAGLITASVHLPHDTDRIKSVDLPRPAQLVDDTFTPSDIVYVAECTSLHKVPTGSQGTPIPCIDLVIKRNSQITWKDQMPGTMCSAIAASQSILAVGTTDGSVQLFGNSPTIGWTSGIGFRSHPPLVFGSTIVRVALEHRQSNGPDTLELLVVAADASFGVYTILPSLTLLYKGSILPAMAHVSLGASISGEIFYPKLSRIQLTQSGRLLLLLSATPNVPKGSRIARKGQSGVGGSLQAFVYDRSAELWLRVSDSLFVLSDFYTCLPSSRAGTRGPLSQVDDAVKMGSLHSPLESSHRNRYESKAIYENAGEQTGNYVASRSHCEDRMACAAALQSSAEFKVWLSRYVRTLVVAGNESQLRMLVDMLLGSGIIGLSRADEPNSCWWLSSTPELLQLDRKVLVQNVITEMSKNLALQRVANEISIELGNM
jgi:protein HIRA/HIR1